MALSHLHARSPSPILCRSSHYSIHHNFAIYGGAKINNIGGHSQTIFSNIFAYPSVYGPSCLWVGQWAKPGFGPHMYDNTCILTPGDHYIDLLGHCFFDLVDSFAPHINTHDNKVLMDDWNTSKGLVSGCFGRPPPPPPPQLRPVSSCTQPYPNTTVNNGYTQDIHGLYEFPAATAEICRETCANYSYCSAGEWYLSEQNPGNVEPGTPPRNQEMLCYLFHLPAIAGPVGVASVRQKPDGLPTSFNCTKGLVPVPKNAPDNGYLNWTDWTALGLDDGTTIAELPPQEDIIAMGMAVLMPSEIAVVSLKSDDTAAAFVFNVSDGGGATLTIGSAKTSTFYMQSQFSEPPTGEMPRWTTLQPPWGGTPPGFVVDRSGEAYGRTVVRLGSGHGLWKLERVYQVEQHRILVNDTLSVDETVAAGWEVLPIYVRQIMTAEVVGSVKQLVLPGSLYTYDCDSSNVDRGSFGAPQMWMATATAAVGMSPLDDVFRAHGVGFNAALAKYPRATTQKCPVSTTERPTLTLADPHLGLAPGSSVTLEWAIWPFAEDQLDYLDFINVLRSDLGTDTITIPHLGQLGWARCTDTHLHPCTTSAFDGAGRDPQGHSPANGDGFLDKHWESWSPEMTRAFLKQQGQIAVTDNEDWFHGTCGEVDIDGTAFVFGMPPLFEEYLRNVTRTVKAGGGLPVVYMHTQISTGEDACNTTVPPANGSACRFLDDATDYKSCRVINASGGQVHYAKCAKGASLPIFYPTHKNAYGDVMRRYVEKAFKLGFTGIFHDEFGPSLVSYTYDQYDGVSVFMDSRNNLTAKVAHIGLLKDELELELWKDITMQHGGFLLANGAPETRTWIDAMVGAASPSVHFSENSVEHRALHVQAYTPLMLNRYQNIPRGTDDDPKYADIGANVWLNVLAHLDQGVLSFSYDGMWRNSTGSTCYEKMVPITVTQLGRGFIVGRERVISKVNRTFSAPSALAAAAVIYFYELGLLVRTEKVAAGASSVALTLNGPVGSATQQLGIIVWGTGS